MTDREKLELMTKAVDDFKPSRAALGELVSSLERHFELLTSPSATLSRSFRDFWNAGEVIWASSIDSGREISQQEWEDINQRFLPALRAAIQEQLEAAA
jgi:hypothetical protein